MPSISQLHKQTTLSAPTDPMPVSTMTSSPTDTVQVPLWQVRGGAVSVMDYIPNSEHAKIINGTSTFDCSPAFKQAIDAVKAGNATNSGGFYFSSGTVLVPAGQYRCLSTIVVDQLLHMQGSGSGFVEGAGSILSFPAGVLGMIVNNFDTDGAGAGVLTTGSGTIGAVPNRTYGANGAYIEGLTFLADLNADSFPSGHSLGSDPTGGDPTKHGLWIRGMCHIHHCMFVGFQGDGIHLDCSFGIPNPDPAHGNGNLTRVTDCGFIRNAKNGLSFHGGDSNAGYGYGLNFTQNGSWGLRDASFLGNTWIACHANSNALGDYTTENANCRTVFINCYGEVAFGPGLIANQTMVIGDLNSNGWNAGAKIIAPSQSGFNMFGGTNTDFLSLGFDSSVGPLRATNRTSGLIWRWLDSTSTTGTTAYWAWNRELGRSVLQKANSGESMSYYDINATVANGYARNMTDSPWFPGTASMVGIGNHFFGTKAQMRFRGLATSAPATGVYLNGDIQWQASPVAGGKIGFVCTTGGIAGSTAVFKPFGAIDP